MKSLSALVLSGALSGCLFLAASATSQAALLLPGTGVLLGGGPTVAPLNPAIATDTETLNSGGIHGTLTTNVYPADATNPLGGLTFVYTVTNASNSDELERVDVTHFAAYSTDVGYIPSSGVIPSSATRSTIAQDNGDEVGFNFEDTVGSPNFAANTIETLVVHTNATTYGPGTASALDAGAANVPALAPTPEPASIGLLAIGATMLVRRRRA